MQLSSLNQNYSDLKFRGKKTPDIEDLKKIRKFVNCGIDNLADNLTREVKTKAPKAIENIGGLETPKHVGFAKNAIEGVRDLFELPFDLLDDVARRFPDSRLNKSEILKRYRGHALKESEIKALQGLYEDGAKFIREVDPKVISQISSDKGNCNEACNIACNTLNTKLNRLLNQSMAFNKAIYDTKKERFITRLVSGFTAAIFLGNDFFNSAKLKGKTDEEAKKSQLLKQGQEIKENVLEGLMQFGLLSCFSKFVNSNLWASALFGTAISTISRIISRKSSGMRLTRANVPEHSINEFQKAIKDKKEYKSQSEKDKEAKKPLLSFKNILLFCAASIAGGFSLRALKLHTKIGQNIDGLLKKYTDIAKKQSMQNIVSTREELEKISQILFDCGEKEMSRNIKRKLVPYNNLILGETQKTVKLFGKIEVPVSELKRLPLAPFRIVKEIFSYPYKIAKNLANAMGLINEGSKGKMVSPDVAMKKLSESRFKNAIDDIKITKPIKRADFDELLNDPYGIKNIYLRFKQFESKYGADSKKLNEEFGKYIKKMRLASLNNKTVSKVDNSKIAVIAQTTGTLSGMWFNMNDEFNAAVKNGDSKQEAQIAARKRGLTKFARMTSQVAISGGLNSLFKRQYQGSMIGAGLIVALSTVITDIVSRQMTAMPVRKMNKEELEKYQKNHKEGAMSWYYDLIDKLSK